MSDEKVIPFRRNANDVDDLIDFLQKHKPAITDAYIVIILKHGDEIKWKACGNAKTLPAAALALTSVAQDYIHGEFDE